MQPLCFSYSNLNSVLLTFSRAGLWDQIRNYRNSRLEANIKVSCVAKRRKKKRQRFHSLVCSEMSPKAQPLIKRGHFSLQNTTQTHSVFPHFSRAAWDFCPFPLRTNWRSITAHSCQTTIRWSHQTLPTEMMSDISRPHANGYSRR